MAQYVRNDGRRPDDIREVQIQRKYTKYAEGSVLMKMGDTVILCTASVEAKVPPFLRGEGQGWITAEYSLLPRSTHSRIFREVSRGKPSGRTLEIQRLIGRSLRSVVDLEQLGEYTIWVDCDVLQADGGTRTAAVSGAFVALVDAVNYMLDRGHIFHSPIKSFLAATSVGIVDGRKLVDLNFEEDSRAQVDMNLVMTDREELIEIQGTAEGVPFPRADLDEMVDIGQLGILQVMDKQQEALGDLVNLVGSITADKRNDRG